jgi:hypothetical protein
MDNREAERWSRLGHRHRAKAAGNSYSLCPQVTVPILDSKRNIGRGNIWRKKKTEKKFTAAIDIDGRNNYFFIVKSNIGK